MAAQTDVPTPEPLSAPSESGTFASLLKKIWRKSQTPTSSVINFNLKSPDSSRNNSPSRGLIRRATRRVVPGLPRAKTFKRQQSEGRDNLETTKPSASERRAVSVDRRVQRSVSQSTHKTQHLPRASAPDFLDDIPPVPTPAVVTPPESVPQTPVEEKQPIWGLGPPEEDITAATDHHDITEPPSYSQAAPSTVDSRSISGSQYEAQINEDLEQKWILNLSMHFRDKSKREKFFVTYREKEFLWRRVTISLDYREAPEDSLERDLVNTRFQREKSAKIYEAIRDSLQDIQFYNTVTNLKLQTTEGRLHVHVVEDLNEIITYPTAHMVQHLRCRRVRERDLEFDSHMSGFVYKVRVAGQTLIKKEIPGPDTVDEFLYEVNALNSLSFSSTVIGFYGVVIDDEQRVKGLLISYAERGALIDIIYDSQEHGLELDWPTREKWARQIVQGLSDVHESGFVQGDFTLSNIVIDSHDDAKIIDINRRGCPVGWEPPEAAPLIDSNQRIAMYIGVKSDLFQLGMVLWALATLEDEPEAHRRPLRLDPEIEVPVWYRRMVEICLHDNPRARLGATQLLDLFPEPSIDDALASQPISVQEGNYTYEYPVNMKGGPRASIAEPRTRWMYGEPPAATPESSDDLDYFPPRGRSPPSPLPSHDGRNGSPFSPRTPTWFDTFTHIDKTPGAEFDETKTETPNGLAVNDISDMMDEDLKSIEAGLRGEVADELPQTTGGNSRPTEARPPFSVDEAQNIVHETVAGQPSAEGDDAQVYPLSDVEAVPAMEQRSESLEQSKLSLDNGARISDEWENAVREGSAQNDSTKEEIIPPVPTTGQPGDDDIALVDSSSDHYTHDRKPDDMTRSTAATSCLANKAHPPQDQLPEDLTGVGSAYERDEVLHHTISDEDLGLVIPAETTPEVVSPA